MNEIFYRLVENSTKEVIWKIALLLSLLTVLVGCSSYRRNNPSPIGVFYPDHPIQSVRFTKDDLANNNNCISFSQPVKIKSVGMYEEYRWLGNKVEVAQLEITNLDHLKTDMYFTNAKGDYFASIGWLQANGRIEYTGYKTSANYFWEGFGRFLISPFGLFIEILLVIMIVIIKRSSSKSYSRSIATTSSSDGYDSDSYSSYSDSSNYSYSSEYDSNENHKEDQVAEVENNGGGRMRCPDCQSIDIGWSFFEKGNGRCKECGGTGHDNLTETIGYLGSFGSIDDKCDCKTCYGTGQCQTCGGTGIVYY